MKKVRLNVLSLFPSPIGKDFFTLFLGEVGGHRQLSILLGTTEARAIALALEKKQLERPMTHDLFKEVLVQLNYTVQEVLITDLKNNIFWAQMTLSDGRTAMTVDARPSDALAMGLCFAANLYIYASLLAENHLVSTEQHATSTASRQEAPSSPQPLAAKYFKNYSVAALNKMLQQAVEQECYEQAALLRDEINHRNMAQDCHNW